ncbi:hypothetical protein OMCYN_01457 [cyanobiont of Ornithocercus magnificus]|nr:hypothetical protein OMCYN_01457 [cyanobiont of Ornithocercus magnificus]
MVTRAPVETDQGLILKTELGSTVAMDSKSHSSSLKCSESAGILSRRGLERLDLLLLTIESLDLNGGEAMLWNVQQLGLQKLFPNRVELWKRRCHNPLRRTTRRGMLSTEESNSLLRLLCMMAERLYPLLHQLLSTHEPEQLTRQRWRLLEQRLRDLIEERMNLRRGAVRRLLSTADGPRIRRQLICTLALAAGPAGIDRLRASLLDSTL